MSLITVCNTLDKVQFRNTHQVSLAERQGTLIALSVNDVLTCKTKF